MNNYYPYGYSPYPGQPPNQPYGFPTAPPFPTQTYPPPANHGFDAYPQPHDPYEASQNIIPGLGFAPPAQAFGWQQPMQTPQVPHPSQAHQTSAIAPAPVPAPAPLPQQHLPSREEPKLIPASQYYQPADTSLKASMSRTSAPSGGVRPPAAKKIAKGTEDAEEGELSEGEFDDLYEPAETIMGTAPSHTIGKAPSNATVNHGRNAAASVWHSGPSEHRRAASPEALDATGRERSGSYSPHLSPHEMAPAVVDNRQPNTNGLSRQSAAPSMAATSHTAVEDARKKAHAAILHLFPLGVRFQQFVDAGIDETVLKNLFTELGLDISSPPLPAIPGTSVPQASGGSHSPAQAALKPSGTQTPAASNQPVSAAKSAGEERKDRIARLLAAKNAKAAPTHTSADGPQVDPKTKSDKEVLQQQKMEALQKSRDARAHKAAVRKDSLQAPSEGTSPSTTRPPAAKVAPAAEALPTNLPQQPEPASASTSAIPGLFMSAAQPAARNQRKRPVAANFITDTQSHKRPFGYHRQEMPFVIDVSDASDDEDVEMEIGSPTDESTGIQQATPSNNTASFREFPPLTDGRPQLSPGPSNVATPQSGIIAAPPKQGHLEVMDKQIEAMKRKIALAEAKRRLKASMNGQASGPKSNGQTPEAAAESDVGKPNMRRVQSMGASGASDQPSGDSSPVVAEASSSMRLPKPSENKIQNASIRAEKRRAVSTSLPLVESRLQAKKSKLRLLQSQMTRLQKEIEEDDAEREKLAREMEQMEQDSDEATEPQSQLKSNSVDPVVTEVPTRAHSEVQTSQPAAETTMPPSTSYNETAASNSSITAIPMPQPPVAQRDGAPAIGFGDADNAAVGLVTTDPAGIPDAADEAVAALPNASAGLVASVNEVEDSRPATSSSDSPSDVVMGGSESSNSQDEEQSQEAQEEPYQVEESESSDAYEPPEAFAPSDPAKSPSISPVPAGSTVSLANSDADPQELNSRASPIPEQISLGVNESTPEQGVDAVPQPAENTDETATNIQYTPYESPLQYFRAYRYHPKFAETVAGGLRSLTFSNKIDPKLPICPDQLANRDCPRGADCIYQHFETMQLPDDQILLQLGGSQIDGPQKAQYNDGLRKLLQEMRSQNIKDFPSIAQGIVDYHNRFTGDPSKILPLGNISI
ncbi:hypothetical protein CkaCkLH20_02990 [Colletotrichum karsti]|uniref:C3H1-type domain-containing protein n=1 Tax=Colletotrichum karsti TaxID=1095194 RepID=A0A9P6I9Q0_9PEZI|nr:uncharacterized protein CkaCkLH20_02990 [Colletotrichum karsti]KAF9879447.1 hypothetical protein CkaCkLH20_02990 [Colletotrichum karsti]